MAEQQEVEKVPCPTESLGILNDKKSGRVSAQWPSHNKHSIPALPEEPEFENQATLDLNQGLALPFVAV